MWLLDGLIELIAPTRCGGCELPGSVLCEACHAAALHATPEHCCPACGAPYGALVCTECWNRSFSFTQAVSAGELVGPLARAVVLHKDAGERRLGAELGALTAGAVPHEWLNWTQVVTWVPATQAAARRRGFDHGRGIAQAVAQRMQRPCVPLLSRATARDQRSLGRGARAQNASGSFGACTSPPGRVLLVDDVFTTGATLHAAAEALLEAGSTEVRIAAVARAW